MSAPDEAKVISQPPPSMMMPPVRMTLPPDHVELPPPLGPITVSPAVALVMAAPMLPAPVRAQLVALIVTPQAVDPRSRNRNGGRKHLVSTGLLRRSILGDDVNYGLLHSASFAKGDTDHRGLSGGCCPRRSGRSACVEQIPSRPLCKAGECIAA